MSAPTSPRQAPALPDKANFELGEVAFLDSGYSHPVSQGAREAVRAYVNARCAVSMHPGFGLRRTGARVCAKFAALVNVDPGEICLVQSTTAAEHLVLQTLGIPLGGGRIVTDTLHFFGSFYLYQSMARAGMDVVWLRPRDGMRIDTADIAAAVSRGTRLVAVSLVSSTSGFQHDLRKVCEIAHAAGACVYADIVHAAGAIPVDLRASGVDFAGCASYKWLMGDFGLGFLYVRHDLLERFGRTRFGYFQIDDWDDLENLFDPPRDGAAGYAPRQDATGYFATGTLSGAVVAQLDYSLDYLRECGIETIQQHRQPLLDRARRELERTGYRCITPDEARTPLLSFTHRGNVQELRERLEAAKVKITVGENRFRISPSVFNDLADIDRLIEALS